MGLTIRLLGRPAIYDQQGQEQAVRGHQSWALLARVLLSPRDITRREIAAELFPETADPLGSLRWCLAALRRAIGSADALGGDPIKANLPPDTCVDVHRLQAGQFDADATGELLEGIEPRSSPEFTTWLLIERERTAGLIDTKVRQETLRALSNDKSDEAMRLAELGVRRLPFDEGAHILLVKSLMLAGRDDAARQHVKATEKAFIAELGVAPTPALHHAARRIVCKPLDGVSSRAVAAALLDSGLAALSGGAADAGVEYLRRAATEADHGDDLQLKAKTMLELGTALVHAVRGYDDEGALLLHQAAVLAEQCAAPQLATNALREIGYVEALAGRRPAAAEYLERARRITTDPESLAGIHAVAGFNLVDWGKIPEGLEQYERALDYARSAGNLRRQAWALGLGAWGHLGAGDYQAAQRWSTDCLAIVDELRWIAFRPWPVAVLAEANLKLRDNADKLIESAEKAFVLSRQLLDPCWEGQAARVLALGYAEVGNLTDAMRWITVARRACRRETDRYVALDAAIIADHACLCAKAGDAEQADSLTRELLAMAARGHLNHHFQWAVTQLGGL
jgi:DNA-binding SARP family transcriptional activator